MATTRGNHAVIGIYRGLDEPTLLQMQTDTLAELAKARAGRRFNNVSGGGKAFTKDNMSVAELHGELAEIRLGLQAVNPDVYGRRIRRVSSSFLNA